MRALLLSLLLALPVAAASSHDPDQGEAPEANVEDEAGVSYGLFVLLGTLLIGGLLAWLTMRRARDGPTRGWKARR